MSFNLGDMSTAPCPPAFRVSMFFYFNTTCMAEYDIYKTRPQAIVCTFYTRTVHPAPLAYSLTNTYTPAKNVFLFPGNSSSHLRIVDKLGLGNEPFRGRGQRSDFPLLCITGTLVSG